MAATALATALAWLAVPGNASAAPAADTRHVQKVGTGSYQVTGTGSGLPASLDTEIRRDAEPDAGLTAATGPSGAHRSLAPLRRAPGTAKGAAGPVHTNPRLLRSFDGLNHRDQRTANNGNQFSLEPPDQALCVGNGYVVEAVNDAFRVYNPDGSGRTGVVDLNTFYGYPPAINRTTGVFGPEITDPTCLYDPTTRHFFLVVLTLEATAEGDLTGANHLDIAVTPDPAGTWDIYRLDVTDDGSNGSPVHPNCPCIGDYPHIGVDAHGFYITTNEYSFFGTEYNSAQIYAFSKRALARGDADVLVTQLDTTAADQGRNGFTIWPAQSPSTRDYDEARHGTAYFLSSNAAEEATGTQEYVSTSIVTWSLTNTRSLDTARPDVQLQNTRVGVRRYSLPPLSDQKPGPVPLAECLNDDPCATVLLGEPDPAKPEVESPLDSNDTRMQQVTYVNGKLYGALDTAVTVGGATKAGIGWYIVRPRIQHETLRADLVAQGQLGLAGNNLIYPAIGINAAGDGVMSFTLVGTGYHPSAAYSAFDGRTGAGAIYLAKAGVGPQDGFSGYKAFGNPPRPRWGDYGATAVDGATIWVAAEYVAQSCTLMEYEAAPFGSCGGTRTALANWATRISQIKP
ncbi:hypothetical protein ADL15_33590 [Actinoplanes awajinensis subsp. mycoplanecinus]|uniref:Uncharacterized protein n=1 Tax=Actinoplanes awajinensis subsp. mycoplanecinus TaxID=135947 RepID=A0A117MNX9_9ACTN|nr:hypothetical protein ADL15_33590 [Actinoplanes awajinensis subsp. mycoplanecinus]